MTTWHVYKNGVFRKAVKFETRSDAEWYATQKFGPQDLKIVRIG